MFASEKHLIARQITGRCEFAKKITSCFERMRSHPVLFYDFQILKVPGIVWVTSIGLS